MARKSRQGENSSSTCKACLLWSIAVYIRLSREDGNEESESVVNQKKILAEFVEQYFDSQYIIVDYYIDARLI